MVRVWERVTGLHPTGAHLSEKYHLGRGVPSSSVESFARAGALARLKARGATAAVVWCWDGTRIAFRPEQMEQIDA